jgi:glycosyltransferase involved in cell wall biosynthesis
LLYLLAFNKGTEPADHARQCAQRANRFMISVAFDLRDPVRSGIARVARSLAQSLARRADRDDPPRIALTFCGPLPEMESLGVRGWSRHPVRLVDWPAGRHSIAAQLQWPRVRRKVGDAVWFFPQWDAPWFALPRRYVAMVHDLTLIRVHGATSNTRRRVTARWMRHTVRHAARVVVPSRYTARDLGALVPQAAAKTRLVSEGVDANFFVEPPPLPESIRAFVAAGPCMLSVGNRKPHKNLITGVQLLARIPGLRWVVMGEWFEPWEQVAAAARTAGVADRMLVLDPQSDQVLCGLYHAATCLLFPSRSEGFGLPLAEAAACGLPVVSSTAGSLPEVGGECATYCDPDDLDAFEAAVRAIVALPHRQPAACVQRARRMTWDASADQLLEILEEVA